MKKVKIQINSKSPASQHFAGSAFTVFFAAHVAQKRKVGQTVLAKVPSSELCSLHWV